MADSVKDVEFLELVSIIGFDGNAPKGLQAHPDGIHVVYPMGNKLVIQNTKTKAQWFLEGHNNVISAVAISKTGRLVASGQVNHMGFRAPVIVWDFEARKIVLRHETHKVRVEHVLFTSCENYIMSLGGRDDSNIVVFDILSNEAVCGTFSSNRNAGDALTLGAMNLRGVCFMTGGVTTLKVWTLVPKSKSVRGVEVAMGKIKRKVVCIEIEKSDTYAYCGTTTGDIMKVKLFYSDDLDNLDPLRTPALIGCFAKIPKRKAKPGKPTLPELYKIGVRQIALLDNDELLVGAGDGTIELIKEHAWVAQEHSEKLHKLVMPTNPLFEMLKSTTVGALVTSLQVVKNKIIVGTIRCEMFVVDLNTFNVQLQVTCHTSTIFALAFPCDYSGVFATASKNDVRVWNVAQCRELLRITVLNFTCSGLTFSCDGRCLLTSWNDGNIRAFTPQSGKHIFTILNAHNKGVSALAITRDGTKIISGGGEGQVRLWSVRKEKQNLIAVLKEHKGPVSSISISKSDKEAASASTDGTCIIWDIVKNVRIAILFSSTLFMSVQYHPSDCQILTCGTNRMIGYWEVFDGTLIREVEGSMSAALNTLDITSDGVHFVTGGNDQYVKVWLYKEGITTHVGLGHAGVITAVKVSPDKQTIVSCSADGAIFIWKSPFPKEKRTKSLAKREPENTSIKEEYIGKISPTQSVHSTPSSPKGQKDTNRTNGDIPEGGSVKCYCKEACSCKSEDLPKTPKSPPQGNAPDLS